MPRPRACLGTLGALLFMAASLVGQAVRGQDSHRVPGNKSGLELSGGALFVIPSIFFGQGSLGIWSEGRWSVRFKANYGSFDYDHLWLFFLDAKYRLSADEDDGAYVFFGPGVLSLDGGIAPWVTTGLGVQYALDKSGSSGVYAEARIAPPIILAVGVSAGVYFRF